MKCFALKFWPKTIAAYLLLKIELCLNGTCKTSKPKITSKIVINLSSSLIKVEYKKEIFLHESFCKSFRNSWQTFLATLKSIQKLQAHQQKKTIFQMSPCTYFIIFKPKTEEKQPKFNWQLSSTKINSDNHETRTTTYHGAPCVVRNVINVRPEYFRFLRNCPHF